ncbi:helix-turn-helix transcriptional regulator [Mycobacterium sp. WMMD1722]|uniref:helix-turn-helix transcriptional regulator n=1 Tax=Mycobacterium sp. WMMD1722 TaxID=3404117 RepID=UPI003BF46A03
MDRHALADFLRRRRDANLPGEVGLPSGARRRTAGLRREEVAQLTGMSVDYYSRLEQARSTQPSPQMVRALARALRLTDDESDHLHRLAGHAVPDRRRTSSHVRPALLFVLDQLSTAAAFVCTDTYVTLAQNDLSRALLGESIASDLDPRNGTAWRWFADPQSRAIMPEPDHAEHSRGIVADLRATWARRRGDRDIEALVDGLLQRSAEFAGLWTHHEVAVTPARRKTFATRVGPITLDCEVLDDNGGQRLVILVPPVGSTALDDLRLLAIVGD